MSDTIREATKSEAKKYAKALRGIANYLDPKLGSHTEGYRMARDIDAAIGWIEQRAGLLG